jgi:hypothetical protein
MAKAKQRSIVWETAYWMGVCFPISALVLIVVQYCIVTLML